MLSKFALTALVVAASAITISEAGLEMPIGGDTKPCTDFEAKIDAEIAVMEELRTSTEGANDAQLRQEWEDVLQFSQAYQQEKVADVGTIKDFARAASAGMEPSQPIPASMPTREVDECTKAEADALVKEFQAALNALNAELSLEAWLSDSEHRASCEDGEDYASADFCQGRKIKPQDPSMGGGMIDALVAKRKLRNPLAGLIKPKTGSSWIPASSSSDDEADSTSKDTDSSTDNGTGSSSSSSSSSGKGRLFQGLSSNTDFKLPTNSVLGRITSSLSSD